MFNHKRMSLPALILTGLVLSFGANLRADETKTSAPASQQGGLLPGETRDQKRERLVAGIEKQVGTLTPEQKTHILAVLKAAGDEMAAARENTALTADQQNAVVRRVHGEVSTRISAALTEAQQAKLKDRPAAGAQSGNWGGRGGRGGRSNETLEQRRARLLQRYEDSITGLSVKQKSDLMAASDASFTSIAAIRADATLTDAQKEEALQKAYTASSEKVDAILTEAQRAQWKQAASTRRGQGAPAAVPAN